jgi:DNA-binding response OmpR family regulator
VGLKSSIVDLLPGVDRAKITASLERRKMYRNKRFESSVLNILLIDDDEDDFLIIQDMLENVEMQRYKLAYAETYEQGLEKAKKQDWDAVLVDYDLGDKDGIELIREAVSEGVEGPFIMVTGRGNREKDVEAMQAGASEYVTKYELSSALLERVIRYARERTRVEKELEQRVQERTEELQNALEELTVMEEELRIQFDELSDTQSRRDAEYAHYKDLYEFAPIGYLITDKYGTILEANLAASYLLNTDKKFLTRKPLSIYVAQESKKVFSKLLTDLTQNTDHQEWKLVINPREMDPKPVRMIVKTILDQEGNVLAGRWLMLDERQHSDQ